MQRKLSIISWKCSRVQNRMDLQLHLHRAQHIRYATSNPSRCSVRQSSRHFPDLRLNAAVALVSTKASQVEGFGCLKEIPVEIKQASSDAELRAAAYLRAASFYTYPEGRSEWSARSHRRMKADAEWDAVTAKVKGTEPAYKDVTVIPFIATIRDEPGCQIARQVEGEMLDKSTKLPADPSSHQPELCRLVVGTLDVNQGRNLPAEELQGKLPKSPDSAVVSTSGGTDVGDPSKQRAYLSNVCVSVSMRRRGVAKSLIETAESVAARHGVTHMYVHVVADNAPAVKLYQETLGYQIESEETEAYARGNRRPRRLLLCKKLVQS